MEYRSLGRTGTKVSTLCLGCLMFGGKTNESDSMDIIDRAIDGGINFFDTANMYVRGKSEEMVGKAFKRNGKRAQIVLATKVHFRMDDDDPNAQGNSRRHIVEQCEASLATLTNRLYRPLPDPSPLLRYTDRRNTPGVGRSNPSGQSPLHRQQHLRGMAGG